VQLTVKNEGPEIASSNFWETDYERRGLFYLSLNAGAFRLLVPSVHDSVIAEFRTAKEIVISRGPWEAQGGRDSIEILFDDGTDDPFSLHLDAQQLDRLPAADDAGKKAIFTAWLKGPTCAYVSDCFYRIVPEIPWLKPWER
jgi:hypothetical protein